MIGNSKNSRENYLRKCFRTPEKETRVKFNRGLSANRPSNNWAQKNKRDFKAKNMAEVTAGTRSAGSGNSRLSS